MSHPVSISVRGLGKCYLRGAKQSHHDTVLKAIAWRARKALRLVPREAAYEEFWALRDASFDIRRGENVGIIGLNGAGKSTLLKMLSRITEPTTGYARMDGRVGALLEVGTGFHPELTGRENVFMYGSVLGMTRAEVARKYDEIVEFSEVADFIETPVKRYSSGMYVRLAFAVAAHMDTEILFLDEVLAVGDLAFQRKCLDHAKRMQERDATILFVSHNMFSIKSMCDRVIYVKKGRIEFDGSVEEGIARYEQDCRLTSTGAIWGNPDEWPIKVTGCELRDAAGNPKIVFDMGERITVRVKYTANQPIASPNFLVSLVRSDGVVAELFSSEIDGVQTGVIHGEGTFELRTPPLKLTAEMYTVNIGVREPGFASMLCSQTATTMHIRHELLNTAFGVVHEPGTWSVPNSTTAPIDLAAAGIRRQGYRGA